MSTRREKTFKDDTWEAETQNFATSYENFEDLEGSLSQYMYKSQKTTPNLTGIFQGDDDDYEEEDYYDEENEKNDDNDSFDPDKIDQEKMSTCVEVLKEWYGSDRFSHDELVMAGWYANYDPEYAADWLDQNIIVTKNNTSSENSIFFTNKSKNNNQNKNKSNEKKNQNHKKVNKNRINKKDKKKNLSKSPITKERIIITKKDGNKSKNMSKNQNNKNQNNNLKKLTNKEQLERENIDRLFTGNLQEQLRKENEKENENEKEKEKDKKKGKGKGNNSQLKKATNKKIDLLKIEQNQSVLSPNFKKKMVAQRNKKSQKKLDLILTKYKIDSKKQLQKLNLVICGHVDAGKSTITGHLLTQLGLVSNKQTRNNEKESEKLGKPSFKFAWVMDSHEEERVHGVTIDVGITHFETKTKDITLLDTPGHKDFIPNMISGAAQADVAILVIDSRNNSFEAGFKNGQTKEHVLLLRSLSVSQIIVAVNKMDYVNWSQSRYDEIVSILRKFLRSSGFSNQNYWFVPVSGLTGDNLYKPVSKKVCAWYDGKTMYETIDNFAPVERPIDKPLRVSITDLSKDQIQGLTISGKIESGVVMKNDSVLVMPLFELCKIRHIYSRQQNVLWAKAGDNIEFLVSGVDEEQLTIGQFLCDPTTPIPVVQRFTARIVTLNPKRPITKGYKCLCYIQNNNEPITIVRLLNILDNSTGKIKSKKPRLVPRKTSATVVIEPQNSLCLENFSFIKELARFTLREDGITVAMGIVKKITKKKFVEPTLQSNTKKK
ncbi:hbs1-like protein [Anaeramoeba flamelloides]|uniref:Hbs1-like protein n=1 Tax=Anaeramoeba flamelloides TaxID=1746091 RepID=A0AAV7YM77_9EUKA|nr:hbs1-like protein [Anaeramoeba flamelloides]